MFCRIKLPDIPYFIVTIINGNMDLIGDLIIDNIIINAINTIRKNKKWPNETSIYKILNKNLENANLTKITLNNNSK